MQISIYLFEINLYLIILDGNVERVSIYLQIFHIYHKHSPTDTVHG